VGERRFLDLSPVVATCILLFTLTFFWYLQAVGFDKDEMSDLELRAIPVYMAAVVAGECLSLVIAAHVGRRFLGSQLPAALLGGALFTLNFYCTFLGYFGAFLVQSDRVQLAVFLGAFALACLLAREMQQNRALRIAAVIVGPLLLASLFVENALAGGGAAGVRQRSSEASLSPGMATDAPTVRKVDFARRPNVYLISFDALTSDEIASRYIGIGPPLEYTKTLEANGARLLANAFSDGNWTKTTLNAVFALDVDYFDSLSESHKFGFFAGRRRSPLAEIFRHNGYRIQTLYRDNFLGRWQGPYVDFYGVASVGGICNRVETRLGFLGYCTRQMLAVMRWLVPAIDRAASGPPHLDFVLERIRVAARDGNPWLTLAYLPSPGHVDMAHDNHRASDRDAFRETFNRNQIAVAREIETVIATIRELDPGAIVLVFGDHGPMLTRNQTLEEDPEFFVLDHHAIRMAIWPGAACRVEFDGASRGGFITIAMAVRAIIICLADGVDPVNKSVTYSLPYWTKDRYDRYLYDNAPKAPAAFAR